MIDVSPSAAVPLRPRVHPHEGRALGWTELARLCHPGKLEEVVGAGHQVGGSVAGRAEGAPTTSFMATITGSPPNGANSGGISANWEPGGRE
ncbi:hypothetical protein ABZ760_32265 [Streptomyces sp. NPDC006658]|uniref:hypothetical protein n=1 Tax=Streptomyces sp. NPDC006658 TaxID=3156900 RepID=UPI003411B9CA